jgi:hypothetical protein
LPSGEKQTAVAISSAIDHFGIVERPEFTPLSAAAMAHLPSGLNDAARLSLVPPQFHSQWPIPIADLSADAATR